MAEKAAWCNIKMLPIACAWRGGEHFESGLKGGWGALVSQVQRKVFIVFL